MKQQMIARKLIVKEEPHSIISEQYRVLRTNIKFSSAKKLKSFVVTSAIQGEGKSTTAANLAQLFAEEKQRVLFIDADLRKPTVHFTFNLQNTIGFSLALSHQLELEACIQKTEDSYLDVMTSGPIPPNPSELLGSERLNEIKEQLEKKYDWVIFDTSPLLAVTDTQLLANRVDGVVLVVDMNKTQKKMVKKAQILIENAEGKILGVVLNNVASSNINYYSSKYYGSYVKK